MPNPQKRTSHIKNELTRNWVLLFAASTGVICSSIVLPFYSLGALVVPMTEEFGWTRAEFQLALLFSTGTGVLTAPAIGVIIDRFGARPVALSGLLGLSSSPHSRMASFGCSTLFIQRWLFSAQVRYR